ncbi:hypothetical protein OsI_16269 [Oryza sativa Indica Group]|uniref:Uncharacterized protein n=1 Tax=Oryza sativa subsp. indica TaxID=39946 RepID=B8AVI1_ORYSI|nr:hypothetical protein OsI_16269 [Oryza sativa Indica Group]
MRLAVATFLAIALSLSLLLAGALARPPPAPVRTDAGGGAAPAPQDKGGNLTDIDDYVPAPPPDPVAGKGGAKRSASGPAVVAHKAASYGAAAAMTLLVSCL